MVVSAEFTVVVFDLASLAEETGNGLVVRESIPIGALQKGTFAIVMKELY